MSESRPQPLNSEQARSALAEVDARRKQVRRSDRQLVWLLLIAAVAYLVAGIVVSTSPHQGTQLAGPVVLALIVGAVVAVVVVGLRIHAFSRAAIIGFFVTLIAFQAWNVAVISASLATHFWSPGQPASNFGISMGVASIPLFAGAWLIWRRT